MNTVLDDNMKLGVVLCLLFLCFESSIAGLAQAQQVGLSNNTPVPVVPVGTKWQDLLASSQGNLLKSAPLTRLFVEHAKELPNMNVVMQRVTSLLHSSETSKIVGLVDSMLSHNNSAQETATQAFPNLINRLSAMNLSATNLTSMSIVAPGYRPDNETALPKFGTQKTRNALGQMLSAITHTIKSVNTKSKRCNFDLNQNGCVEMFNAIFLTEGLVAGLGLAKAEITGVFYLLSIAFRGAIDPKSLTDVDKQALEDSVPGVKSSHIFHEPSSTDVPLALVLDTDTDFLKEDPDEIHHEKSSIDVKAVPSTEGSEGSVPETNTQTKTSDKYFNRELTLQDRVLLLAFGLGSLVDDLIFALFAFFAGLGDGIGPADARPEVTNVVLTLYILTALFTVTNIFTLVLGDTTIQEKLKNTYHTEHYGIAAFLILAMSMCLVLGVWLISWGSFTEIGFDRPDRGTLRHVGFTFFTLGWIGAVIMAYFRAQQVHHDIIEGKSTMPSNGAIVRGLLIGLGLVVGSLLAFYIPFASYNRLPSEQLELVILVLFIIVCAFSIGVSLLGSLGFLFFFERVRIAKEARESVSAKFASAKNSTKLRITKISPKSDGPKPDSKPDPKPDPNPDSKQSG